MNTVLRKLTSRKLWMAIASFVGMLLVANGRTEADAAAITAIIMGGATVIAYIFGEGLVDAANAGEHETKVTEPVEDIWSHHK